MKMLHEELEDELRFCFDQALDHVTNMPKFMPLNHALIYKYATILSAFNEFSSAMREYQDAATKNKRD